MASSDSPIVFEPIFQERIWGGRKLAELFAKKLPPNKRIGESWEIVDRPEAQSIVRGGPLSGRSLHDLWVNFREELFGKVSSTPRFPLLIKLLDAREKLSLQVHPPAEAAESLGGEAKTEFWYGRSCRAERGNLRRFAQDHGARAIRAGVAFRDGCGVCSHRSSEGW